MAIIKKCTLGASKIVCDLNVVGGYKTEERRRKNDDISVLYDMQIRHTTFKSQEGDANVVGQKKGSA